MPIYEYGCQACRHRFELWQNFNDKPVDTCPKCQGMVRRIISPLPIIFKGSGFYVTDNRGKDPDTAPPPKPAAEPKPAAQPEKKS